MLYKNVTELIGNTPTIEISRQITGLKHVDLYVKCELYNPFGSLKDRAAYSMLKDKIADIKQSGATVIESSSGNTAKALQILCAMNGIAFKTVTNRIKVPETKNILKVCGAQIEELPGLSECPDPTDPNDPVAYIERTVAESDGKYYHTNQYTNLKNPQIHYETTGPEIERDVGKVDYFFSTLGTTGSSRGIIEYLKEKNPALRKIGIIADKGDNIPGIRNKDEMYEVGIFEKSLYDGIVTVNSMQAIEQMLILNRKLGILGGPTSGACFYGAMDYLKKLDETLTQDIKAVFVACDRMEWYMSYIEKRRPDLFNADVAVENIRNMSESDVEAFAKTVDAENVGDFMEQNAPVVIDMRGNLAYKNGHIKNAVNITDVFFDDIVENGTPFSAESTVLLVCATGDKSKKYSALLNKKGLNVYSLDGGMVEYRNQGLPVVRQLKRTLL